MHTHRRLAPLLYHRLAVEISTNSTWNVIFLWRPTHAQLPTKDTAPPTEHFTDSMHNCPRTTHKYTHVEASHQFNFQTIIVHPSPPFLSVSCAVRSGGSGGPPPPPGPPTAPAATPFQTFTPQQPLSGGMGGPPPPPGQPRVMQVRTEQIAEMLPSRLFELLHHQHCNMDRGKAL